MKSKVFSRLPITIALVFLLLQSCTGQLSYLQKYSYHVIGLIDLKPKSGGTGFFVHYKSKYYLVSAWHCFSFRDPLTEKYISLENAKINQIAVYRDVADIERNNPPLIKLFDSITNRPVYLERRYKDTVIDISAIEILRKYPFLFDYIELTSANTEIVKEDDLISYFGFPILNGRQVNISQPFTGKVIEIFEDRREFIMAIEGYIGCSGSPLFKMGQNGPVLKGINFYAKKDQNGRAFLCKGIDITWLFELLDSAGL